MSVYYQMEGSIKVKNCKEVEEIVYRFNDASSDDLSMEFNLDRDLSTMTITVSGGAVMSYCTATDLDDIATELCEFAVEDVFFVTNADGEISKLYVGRPDHQDSAESHDALEEIKELLPRLMESDKKALMELLGQ